MHNGISILKLRGRVGCRKQGKDVNPDIPKDAIEYFRSVFAEANRVASERIVNVPNIRETSLDDAIVDALVPLSPPKRLKLGAIVEMDIHNIGGLRRLSRWETGESKATNQECQDRMSSVLQPRCAFCFG